MQNSLSKIIQAQISDELSKLDEISGLLKRRVAWLEQERGTDPYIVEDVFAALAMTMHDFYTGCERVLTRLINNIDGGISKSREWHQEVLYQATLSIPGVREPIISDEEVYGFLSELRGLRHVIRNVYVHQLKRERLLSLGRTTFEFYPRFKSEIIHFLTYLEAEPSKSP